MTFHTGRRILVFLPLIPAYFLLTAFLASSLWACRPLYVGLMLLHLDLLRGTFVHNLINLRSAAARPNDRVDSILLLVSLESSSRNGFLIVVLMAE